MDLKEKGVYNQTDGKHALRIQKGKLPVIICGGGAGHKWYEDGILQNWENLRNILVEGFSLQILPVEKLMPNPSIPDHRLFISYSLSKRIEGIPEIEGFPWDFSKSGNTKENTTAKNNYDDLQEIAREKYGEPL
jgi:hypothetical protein